MSEREGFIRDIRESPEDDTPRLIFADWLEDHGDEARAEFIRLQCELERGDPFAPGRRALLVREFEMVRRHGENWIRQDGLAEHIEPASLWHHPPKTRFRRGFVDRAWFLNPSRSLAAAPALFARAPITGIHLHDTYDIPEERQTWFMNTYMNVYLREIGVGHIARREPGGTDFPEPEEFRRLVAAPPFVGLRALSPGGMYGDRRHLRILADSPAAAHLRELNLGGSACVVGGAWGELADAPNLAGLEYLRIDDCHLRREGLRLLVASPHLKGLRRLSFEADPDRGAVGPEGIGLLCSPGAFPRLEELNIRGQGGGAAGLRLLAGWPGLARLTRLDIAHFWNERDTEQDMADGYAEFTRSPHWGAMRELNLEGGNLTHLEAVLGGPNLRTLRIITFAFDFIDQDERPLQDEAAALLARCPHLSEGVEAHISRAGLSSRGLRLLRERFGDGLVLYPGNGGLHRQPGDWGSGRPSRSSFADAYP